MSSELDDAAAWYSWFKRSGGRALREVVLREWDPIGVGEFPEVEDEYDDYLGRIAQRLRQGKTVEELADFLEQIRTEWMELPKDRSGDVSASEALIRWYQGAKPSGSSPSAAREPKATQA